MSNSTQTPFFKEVRDILKEVSVSQKETDQRIKETDQHIKELFADRKETTRQIKELFADRKETTRQIEGVFADRKETTRQIEGLFADQKETTRQIKGLFADQRETARQIKELQKETARQIAENSKGIKSARNLFETQWGRLVESLVEGKLLQMLNERGIEVQYLSQRTETSYKREDGQIQMKEFDIIAVNGNEAVAVEVKTTLTPEKVTHFTDSLKDFKKYFSHYDRLNIYGAVAYLRSESSAHIFAQRQGLLVIRATGDSAGIINTKDFKPKVFA